MVKITLTAELEKAAIAEASRAGVSPQELVLDILRTRLLPRENVTNAPLTGDQWERKLTSAAVDCGVSLSNEALSSEGLYE